MTYTFSVVEEPCDHLEWNLISFSGEEAISDLYWFRVVVSVEKALIESAVETLDEQHKIEDALLGKRAAFEMGRTIYGVISSVFVRGTDAESIESGTADAVTLEITVSPKLWMLQHRKVSKIFQFKYAHEIVSDILGAANINHEWNLTKKYQRRIYCTQYQETDYEFVTRLFAEVGIFFFFKHVEEFEVSERSEAEKELSASDYSKMVAKGLDIAAGLAEPLLGKGGTKLTKQGVKIVDSAIQNLDPKEGMEMETVPGQGNGGPGGNTEVLVFVDDVANYGVAVMRGDDVEPLVMKESKDPSKTIGENEMTALQFRHEIRPKHVELRDYDFERPMLALKEEFAGREGATKESLHIYDHHGEYEGHEVTKQHAELHVEQHRARMTMGQARSKCRDLIAGHTFDMSNIPTDKVSFQHMRGRSYALTKIHHEGYLRKSESGGSRQKLQPIEKKIIDGLFHVLNEYDASRGDLRRDFQLRHPIDSLRSIVKRRFEGTPQAEDEESYGNRFEWVPAEFAFRPPRPKRELKEVMESAVVVGPVGKEIYTDNYGRIKVQFHWDREQKWTQNSSCWIRVLSASSGAGFGLQFIPRIGMEVLVTFLGGDPDRPVVVGCLYNGIHPTPEPLPYQSSRSVIRTQSTPGGGGFNELSFDDTKGRERLYMHAEKDFDIEIKDGFKVATNGQWESVIGGNWGVSVSKNVVHGIQGFQTVLVGKDSTGMIAGNHTWLVNKSQSEHVKGHFFSQINGWTIQDSASDRLTRVQGDDNVVIYGNSITQITSSKDDDMRNAVLYVQGNYYATAQQEIVLKSEAKDGGAQRIRLECGDSYIEMTPDKIVLKSETIELRSGYTEITGKESLIQIGGDKERIGIKSKVIGLMDKTESSAIVVSDAGVGVSSTKKVEISASQEVNLVAPAVNVKSGSGRGIGMSGGSDEDEEENEDNVNIALYHRQGKAANTRYQVVVGNKNYEGTTDGDGNISFFAPEGAESAHISLAVHESFAELYDKPLEWMIKLVEDIPEPSAENSVGVKQRLANLGYRPGSDMENETMDDETKQALANFQREVLLEPTGVLDDDTKTKLNSYFADPASREQISE
jgi:type VI secretion system secreted protein VgrG